VAEPVEFGRGDARLDERRDVVEAFGSQAAMRMPRISSSVLIEIDMVGTYSEEACRLRHEVGERQL